MQIDRGWTPSLVICIKCRRKRGSIMTRKEAETRVEMWLGVSGLTEQKPNYGQAHKLCNLIFNLTDGSEIYTTGFVYDVWRVLRNE